MNYIVFNSIVLVLKYEYSKINTIYLNTTIKYKYFKINAIKMSRVSYMLKHRHLMYLFFVNKVYNVQRSKALFTYRDEGRLLLIAV